jgi:putative ABC transport system permease protein
VPWASWRLVTPGFFETLGVPVLRGRDFTEDDFAFAGEGPLPILISNRVAELLWPGEDPVGRIMTLWAGQSDTPGEVLGVVGDMRERGIDDGPTLAVYLPYVAAGWPPDIVVHTAGQPTAVVPAIRAILAEMDPDIPLSDVTTMEEMVGRSVGSQRFLAVLVGAFAGLALLLALAGVYGVQSYSVARQTAEIGVRVAMGASNPQILRRILLQALRPALSGVAAGLAGAVLLSRFMESLLFEVEATDLLTYLAVALLLMATAVLSAWLPARKATRVDPVMAFRME